MKQASAYFSVLADVFPYSDTGSVLLIDLAAGFLGTFSLWKFIELNTWFDHFLVCLLHVSKNFKKN